MVIKTVFNLLTKNLFLKILSLCIAFVIFLGVQLTNSKEVIQNLELDISYSIPENHMIVNKVTRKVSVVVKGSLKKIEQLKKERPSLPLVVDKSKTIFINDSKMSELKGLNIVEIIPKNIDVVIEEIISKEVAIQFNIINELPAGYKYEAKPKLNKKLATIIGPKSSVDLLEKVYSEPLNQSSIIGSESKLLKLKLENSNLRFKNDREISVSYKIVEEYINKEIKDIDVKFLNCDLDKHKIKPLKNKVTILVKLPYSLKDKFSKKHYFIYADLKRCSEFKRLTEIKLSPATPHRKILIKYISPDTIILKKDIKNKLNIVNRNELKKNKLVPKLKKEKKKKKENK